MKIKLTITFILGLASSLWSTQSITLAWDPSVDTNVTSYSIYWGIRAGIYTSYTNVGTNLTITIPDLPAGTWFFVSTARNDSIGLESDPSNVVWKTIGTNSPPAPLVKSIKISSTIESSNDPLGPWCAEILLPPQDYPLTSSKTFWRSSIQYEINR